MTVIDGRLFIEKKCENISAIIEIYRLTDKKMTKIATDREQEKPSHYGIAIMRRFLIYKTFSVLFPRTNYF